MPHNYIIMYSYFDSAFELLKLVSRPKFLTDQ